MPTRSPGSETRALSDGNPWPAVRVSGLTRQDQGFATMTVTVDMTLIGVLALIAGIAAFFAPRFLGIMVAAGLVLFGAFQLFPELRNADLGRTISSIELDDLGIVDTAPAEAPADDRPS